MDFKDFFPSFDQQGVEEYLNLCNRQFLMELSREDIEFVGNIVCRYGQLTIGAPSSPSLTNAMMYSFDRQVSELTERRDLVYTRYADDLFISSNTPNNLEDIPRIIKDISSTFPFSSLNINDEKTTFLSRRYARRITGLIITPQGDISIGREKKRAIKAMVNSFKYGVLETHEIEQLAGYIAYIRDVENSFYISLQKKYGAVVIDEIREKSETPILF